MARFARIADMIGEVLPDRQAAVLDIGCATGALLAVLKGRGYANLVGVDPSPTCARLASDVHGVRVLPGTVTSLDRVKGPFRLCILAAVLEHLCDPVPALARIHELLDEGGFLLVEVPDVTRFADCIDGPFQQFSTEHISFFSPTSLSNLARMARFEPVMTQQYVIRQNRLSQALIVASVWQKTARQGQMIMDADTVYALHGYIAASAALEERIARRIAELADSRRPMLVWGVGTHTLRLLTTTRLKEANIRAFVDSNPHYQGKVVNGIPVLSPEEACGRDEPILISSAVSQEEIAEQIRDALGGSNELIRLYGDTSGT
jgi:2-polyprenyl-3-methyl-5-hydroxy-6-metoxy-1,4-benzoquinol methylase